VLSCIFLLIAGSIPSLLAVFGIMNIYLASVAWDGQKKMGIMRGNRSYQTRCNSYKFYRESVLISLGVVGINLGIILELGIIGLETGQRE